MLPCPALPDPFFNLSELGGIGDGGFAFGFVLTGSSSENDSHAGSSRVTATHYKYTVMKIRRNKEQLLLRT
jgi:hypothetical protein